MHEEIVGDTKSAPGFKSKASELWKKLADLSRVSKLLTAVILSCL